jgi:hypothetical protein
VIGEQRAPTRPPSRSLDRGGHDSNLFKVGQRRLREACRRSKDPPFKCVGELYGVGIDDGAVA